MEGDQKTSGALIGSVIIVIILIVGGIYLWKVSMKEGANPANPSDSSASLEADANNIDLESVDQGI